MTHDAEANARRERLHRECWEQLPWIANGSLDAHRYAQVEPHLRACPACQEELALQERTRTLIRRDDPVMLAPQAGWQQIVQRMEAEVAGAEPQDDALRRPSPRLLARRWPHWVAIAAGVQTIALAFVLGAQYLGADDELTAPRYETLTSGAPVASKGPVIRLVFHTGVALHDVNALLRAVDAQVVAGPSEAGVYTIALPGERRAERDIDAALARLRADPRVLFAEAAVARSAP